MLYLSAKEVRRSHVGRCELLAEKEEERQHTLVTRMCSIV